MTTDLLNKRNSRKTLIGCVLSRLGDKSVKVTYDYSAKHALYKKEVKRKTVLYVHDEENVCREGDRVEVMETRPLSKLKRWRLLTVLESAAGSAKSEVGGDSHVTA